MNRHVPVGYDIKMGVPGNATIHTCAILVNQDDLMKESVKITS